MRSSWSSVLLFFSSSSSSFRRVSSLTCPVAGSKDPPDDAPDDPPDETPKTARNGPDPFRAPKPPQIDHPYSRKSNRIRRAAKPGNSGSGRAASRASESGLDLGASFLHFSLADRDDARSDTTRSEVNGLRFAGRRVRFDREKAKKNFRRVLALRVG